MDEAGVLLGYTWVLALTEFDATEPHGHIADVGVAAEAQGRGIGSQLIAAAEDWCREQGLVEVKLHCYLGNERAHRLYHSKTSGITCARGCRRRSGSDD